MRYAVTLSLLTAVVVLTVSCSKIYGPVKELDAFIAVKDAVLSDWAKNIDAHPDQQGVDACRKTFEAKKAELIAAKKAFDDAPQGMNPDTVNHKQWASEDSDKKILDAIMTKLATGTAETNTSYRDLRRDFEKATGTP